MATVKAMVRSTARTAKVRFRLSDGRKVQFFIKSGIEVPVALWDDKNECIRKRAVFDGTVIERYAIRSILNRHGVVLTQHLALACQKPSRIEVRKLITYIIQFFCAYAS